MTVSSGQQHSGLWHTAVVVVPNSSLYISQHASRVSASAVYYHGISCHSFLVYRVIRLLNVLLTVLIYLTSGI